MVFDLKTGIGPEHAGRELGRPEHSGACVRGIHRRIYLPVGQDDAYAATGPSHCQTAAPNVGVSGYAGSAATAPQEGRPGKSPSTVASYSAIDTGYTCAIVCSIVEEGESVVALRFRGLLTHQQHGSFRGRFRRESFFLSLSSFQHVTTVYRKRHGRYRYIGSGNMW